MKTDEKIFALFLVVFIILITFVISVTSNKTENKPNIKYIITDKGIVDSNYNNITVEQYDSLCNMFNYYYLNAANDRIKSKFNKLTDKY